MYGGMGLLYFIHIRTVKDFMVESNCKWNETIKSNMRNKKQRKSYGKRTVHVRKIWSGGKRGRVVISSKANKLQLPECS